MRRFLRVLLLCITLSVLPAMAQERTPPPTDAMITGGDDASLRALIGRLFRGFNSLQQTQITVGALDPAIADRLPVPLEATILGTVISDVGYAYAQVYFDTALDTETLTRYYREAFTEGWTEPAGASVTSGFIGNAIPVQLVFCSVGEPAEAVRVVALPSTDGGVTSVDILYQQGAPFEECVGGARVLPSTYIPALTAPDGAAVLGAINGGGNLDQFYSLISLQTSQSPADILAHYDAQLIMVWSPLGSSTSVETEQVFSVWRFGAIEGEEWTGILIVVPTGDDQRLVSLQITRVGL